MVPSSTPPAIWTSDGHSGADHGTAVDGAARKCEATAGDADIADDRSAGHRDAPGGAGR